MCGFSFCISKNNIKVSELQLMNRKISHRGPDKELFINSKDLRDYKIKNKINFIAGFRRLKIIDLSNKANQPMLYNNRYLIVFNGEIYNYLELKEKLLSKNYKFKTKSDTEVILAAYDFWGKKSFKLFNGMWSIIIYDLKKNILIASRDRYGVKPFYYTKIDDSFYFASEIKQLLTLRKINEINKKSLSHYLHYNDATFKHETFIKNIFQLKAGHYLELNRAYFKLKQKKWYFLKKRILNKKNACSKIQNILINSVKLRLRSDVNIGISLSGGIDSTIIASIVANLKKNLTKNIYTFTTRTLDQNDEFQYVKEFNKKYNFKNVLINLRFKNFNKAFINLVKSHDNPIQSLSVYSEWEIFKKMKEKKIRVNLDGHGADEQICGYENYYSLYLIELIKSFKFLKFIKFFKELIFSNIPNKWFLFKKLLINCIPENIIRIVKNAYNYEINKKWIKLNKIVKVEKKIKNNLVLNQNFKQFFETSLPKQLNWSDINSMSHSIETRSPFLDFNLVENILPMEMEHKINGIKTKYIMREAFKKIIPKKIYNRKFKIGFQAPGEKWLKENRSAVKNLLNMYYFYLKDILDPKFKTKCLNIIEGKDQYREWIWKIIFLGAWIKYHNLIVK